jgi:hypothetical protein
MSRTSRTLAAVVLSFALLAAAAPAAHARTLAKPHQPTLTAGSWLDATLAWVGNFFDVASHTQKFPGSQVKSTIQTGPTGGGATPMTGSCVNPWGIPRPCPDGGI